MKSLLRTLLFVALATTLAACSAIGTVENWPEILPDREYFVQAYAEDSANQRLQTEEEYLDWIVRFYEGSLTMPLGWNDLTPALLYNLNARQGELVADKRKELGILIAAEWAKHNDIRLINTEMLSLWGSVMEIPAGPPLRIAAIEQIITDARALLSKALFPRHITEQRYERKLGLSFEDQWEF
ncbi:MAG: hypothetical protein WDZ76_03665 [Pseudohongiellaceae bacterium]